MTGTDTNSTSVRRLDRALQVSLFMLALSAPLSIAATQTAWSFALLFWIIRAFFIRPTIQKNSLDLAVLAFVGLSLISSIFSYEPKVSLGKMMSVSLVTIVYLVAGNIRDKKKLQRLVVVLLTAGMISVIWTIGTLVVGKNLKVISLTPESPLRSAGVHENDTILRANGKSVSSPDDLAKAVTSTAENDEVKLSIYRFEVVLEGSFPVAVVGKTGSAESDLGIQKWSRGRDTRASGFFGHYTTYAEALQLILSLSFGLLIAAPGGLFSRNRILLGVVSASFCVALFFTVTRASWAAFAISAFVILICGTGRKTAMICLACALPFAIIAGFYLQQKRNVSFVDSKDGSTTWRLMVWREGFDLLTSSPKHLAVGIGMDSIKTHWQEWHLFDDGRQPIGHMHSTPLQFALERGVPALIAWAVWMFLYLRVLWRDIRRREREQDGDWFQRGIILGCIGGTIGFLSSGLVHYNWGDSEVVMIFYLLMGLALAVCRPRFSQTRGNGQPSVST